MIYGAFSDESSHTQGRFRSIASVSLPAEEVPLLQAKLEKLLTDASLDELKWSELRGRKRIAAAQKFLDVAIEEAVRGRLRIDTVIWDIEDFRHRVTDRDDLRNYERMYFHLHRSLMARRGAGAKWHLRPDEQIQIDWSTLESCLAADGTFNTGADHPLLSREFASLPPMLLTMKQVKSHDQSICQLADLFAGIAAYSRERSGVIRALLRAADGQGTLIAGIDAPNISKKDEQRFSLVQKLNGECKRHRLGVSLRTGGYFQTKDPANPINFWHYEPQHPSDRAPTKAG